MNGAALGVFRVGMTRRTFWKAVLPSTQASKDRLLGITEGKTALSLSARIMVTLKNALPGPFPPLRGCFGKLFVHELLGGFLFVHCRKLLGEEDAVDVQNHDELGIALSHPLDEVCSVTHEILIQIVVLVIEVQGYAALAVVFCIGRYTVAT